ncbi:lysostaphin resistance A-like protein [Streptococcus tangpeifui]|uniref:CPBP family intramembrane glutamic endopeptidase n=1 Tax=Streptococcus tangpeifui TaxID=2709400 RepID=UPI0013EE27CB|nr:MULTISPECIES: type II CAAX endopeptidase family protein [unclassified Streptococcus]
MKTLLDKLKWIGLAFAFLFLDFLAQTLFLAHKQLSHTGPALIASLGLTAVAVLAWLSLRLLKEPITFKKIKWDMYALYVGIGTVILFVIKIIGGIIHQLMTHTTTSANQAAIDSLGMPIYLYFIFAVVFAPIFEEIIFRKCLFEKLFGFGRWKWLGLIVTSFLFGLLHLWSSLDNLMSLGLWITYAGMGLVIGFTTMMNKRIEFGYSIHVINNAIAVFFILLMQIAQ